MKRRARYLWLAAVVALVVAAGAGCGKKQVTEEAKQRWVKITHAPIEEADAGRETSIQADITAGPAASDIKAFIFYRSGGRPFQVSEMRLLEPGRYFGAIPPHVRGDKLEYYIEARTASDIVVRVPAKQKAEGFVVSIEGRANRYLLGTHIAVIFVALFFFIFAGYLSYQALQHRRSLLYIPRVAFLGTAAFFIASIPLGMAVAYQTYGKIWTGFPVGGDLTDNKSLAILIYWAVCAVLYRGSLWRKDPSHDFLPMVTLPYVHLAGAAITVVLFLLPH
ncbi:MAG: hypothetical protein WAW06_03535 [bacterium]